MKTLGIDLGTNSIGISIRNKDKGANINEQLEYFSSIVFKSGVGNGKSGEFSYAAERTKKRSIRKLYQSRKYRIWGTLKLLIENGYCPLSMEDLGQWCIYDKTRRLKRQYPIHATKFEQWVRLDFDGDGKADYSSPFQLRDELMRKQLDFTNPTDRYKLGRALYHIAQRRGFKSSKGETIKEQEKEGCNSNDSEDLSNALKISEEKTSDALTKYMEDNDLPTIGCAFYLLEKNGIRVRNSEYHAVRSQYRDEIVKIFTFQHGLDVESPFLQRLISEKKGEGTIFYKRPLRSQKGTVGNCTLEPNKPRCPISHPEFEKFRAWSIINNIKFGEGLNRSLTIEQKRQLFQDKFLLTRSSFKFQEIRIWIQKQLGISLLDYKSRTINYKDSINIAGCPISGRLKNLLGDEWESWRYVSDEKKHNSKTGETKQISYDAFDLWHICFSFEDPEYVEEFATNKLKFDSNQTKQLVRVFSSIQQGYGMLSLKAIKNINRFLTQGLIYTDSVLLAKLPEIFKDKWSDIEDSVINELDGIIENNRHQRLIYNIANTLIANYKSLEIEEQFAYKNYEYVLDTTDQKEIKEAIIKAFGNVTWVNTPLTAQTKILNEVSCLYQQFFSSEKRDYYRIPKVADALVCYLQEKYTDISPKDLQRIYHPSSIEFYTSAKEEKTGDGRYIKLLGSPVIGAFKNPMAMRVLHTLRKQVNILLSTTDSFGNPLIDEDTRVVVETARGLNDANMRWAIEEYQREREKENKKIEQIIQEYHKGRNISEEDINAVRLMFEQQDPPVEKGSEEKSQNGKKLYAKEKEQVYKKDVDKYRLWKEQNYRCLYTGKMISISNLFDDNAFDIEHTIPRSLSFDDSLANKTICDAHYNRTIKKNLLPTQLANYKEIEQRLQPWIDKIEQIKDNVEYWKSQSRRSQDKERKDRCIRQKHLWQMELDYWQNKVNRFTVTEVTSGFRNNQLNDTRIITKYAYHYLKTVFNKVDVQKGSVTANFRKMLGVQSVDEKKSRDKHSHHAIDATILTLIPTAAQRDKMLEYFYKIQENKKMGIDTSQIEKDLERELRNCGLPKNISEMVPFIENNIYISHIAKDQTLTPSRRKARIRGKEVFVVNKDGEYVNKWITGDCIRGQIHGESYYGAIKQGVKNAEGKLLRQEDGSIIVGDDIYFVIRRELKCKSSSMDSGFKDWEELEKAVVDKNLYKIMKSQFSDSYSFKEACEHGIFMYKKNKDGVFEYVPENRVNRIRHIRCFTSQKNPLAIKNQTYLSDKDYKQKYYAEMGDLFAMCRYESIDKREVEYHIYSLFDISENRKMNLEDIPTYIESKKHTKLCLSHLIKKGDMLLLYEKSKEVPMSLDKEKLSQRLYVVTGFENPGRINLVKHINAQADKTLGKGESIKDYSKMPEKIRCGIKTLNYLIAGVDFQLTPQGIKYED